MGQLLQIGGVADWTPGTVFGLNALRDFFLDIDPNPHPENPGFVRAFRKARDLPAVGQNVSANINGVQVVLNKSGPAEWTLISITPKPVAAAAPLPVPVPGTIPLPLPGGITTGQIVPFVGPGVAPGSEEWIPGVPNLVTGLTVAAILLFAFGGKGR